MSIKHPNFHTVKIVKHPKERMNRFKKRANDEQKLSKKRTEYEMVGCETCIKEVKCLLGLRYICEDDTVGDRDPDNVKLNQYVSFLNLFTFIQKKTY